MWTKAKGNELPKYDGQWCGLTWICTNTSFCKKRSGMYAPAQKHKAA
jgi:hypothetical protein